MFINSRLFNFKKSLKVYKTGKVILNLFRHIPRTDSHIKSKLKKKLRNRKTIQIAFVLNKWKILITFKLSRVLKIKCLERIK